MPQYEPWYTQTIGAFRCFGVKRETLSENHRKYEMIFNFFMKADIEDQYMHL